MKWLAALTLVLASFGVASASAQSKQLTAYPRGTEAVLIDGKLDEAAWQNAPVAQDFVERLPVPGAAPPVRTQLRVLYDADALYIGVRAELAPGELPKAYNLARDSSRIWNDDALTIKLDVRHDQRSTVGFAINPENAQLDFVSLDNGDVYRQEFDAVWESQTHVEATFWSAEIRIPAAALGLPSVSGPRVLGLELSRDHNAHLATYDWALIPPEFGPFSAQHYGQLIGVQGIATGRPFMLQPYVLASYPRASNDVLPVTTKAGVDARLRLANDTWGELSLLTDFAQADVDDQVVNLNRFPTFFPEKRPFFLTGLDVFEFGAPGTAQLLFTRRIGLDDQNHQVPMLGGAKVYGTSGPLDYGVLDVVTDDTLTLGAHPKDAPLGQSAANWTVGRVRANFAHPGHVGFMIATRDNLDLPIQREVRPVSLDPSVSVGADSLVQGFDDRLVLSTFGAYTRNEQASTATTQGSASQLRLQWLGSSFAPDFSILRVSDHFDPKVGFVSRTGIVQSYLNMPWVNRTRWLGLKYVTLWTEGQLVHDENVGALLGYLAGETLEVAWRSGYSFELQGSKVLDVVQNPFDLFPDVTIEPGHYDGWKVRATVYTPAARNPSFDLQYIANGAFFSGSSHSLASHANIAFSKHVRLTVGAVFTALTLRDCQLTVDSTGANKQTCGSTIPLDQSGADVQRDTLSWNSTITFTPSTQVQADAVFQLNTKTDQAVAMLRLRYRYLPGSDMFLVYQENVDYAGKLESDRRVILKASYRYDTVL